MKIISKVVQVIRYQIFPFITLKTGIIFWLVSLLVLWNMYSAANSQYVEIKNVWVNQDPGWMIKVVRELEILSFEE